MPKYPAGAASGLGDAAVEALKNSSALPFELLGRRVENAIGGFTLPAGMATNMIVDGRDVLIPMATEKARSSRRPATPPGSAAAPAASSPPISGTEKIAQIQMVKLSAPWAGAPRFRRRRPRSARSPGA